MGNGAFAPASFGNIFGGWAVHDGDVGGAIEYADFDEDDDIDGHDFLKWQRRETPELGSADELALWESQFGTTVPPLSALVVPTPEPSTLLLASLTGLLFCSRRR